VARRFTKEFKGGFIYALQEYFNIVMPIAIYIALEAIHKNSWLYVLDSPEWSIATIFLAYISIGRYRIAIERSGRKIFEPIFGIMALVSLLLILASVINAYVSIEHESSQTTSLIITRIFLGLFSSIQFFILITAVRTLKKQS